MLILPQYPYVVYGLRLRDDHEYRYVGITTKGVFNRLRVHISSSTSGRLDYPVNRWIRKHYLAVAVDVLETVDPQDFNLLLFREQFWIAALRESGFRLLNSTDGGQGTLGRTFSEESRLKMSLTQKGKPGRPWSEESKRKVSETKRGRKLSKEHRRNLSIAFTGSKKQPWTEERKEAARKAWSSDRRKEVSQLFLGAANPFYGKTHGEETTLRMSLAKHSKHTDLYIYCLWCRMEYEHSVGRELSDLEVKTLDKYSKRSALWASHRKNHLGKASPVCYFCLKGIDN